MGVKSPKPKRVYNRPKLTIYGDLKALIYTSLPPGDSDGASDGGSGMKQSGGF